MSGDSEPNHSNKSSCIITVVSAAVLLVGPTVGREVSQAPAIPAESKSASLAFRSNRNNEYVFDTGILRGKIQRANRTLGLSSVVHVPSGLRLDGGFGILSYYRIFTTDKRYGHAAWDWPCESRLLPEGAVQIIWPAEKGRPFEITATYRWAGRSTLDLQTSVKALENLSHFEIFLASYFRENFSSPYVYVGANPEAEANPGFLLAKKSFGDWQMFPRDREVLRVIQDGRWKKEPNPVKWAIMPQMAAPICLRRGGATDLTVVLMSHPDDCFAMATPYKGESHYSLYLSLFGRDVKAGETARARSRLVVTTAASDREILGLYQKYAQDLADGTISKDVP
ncbi:MAG: hypothetical protein JSU70_02540 [Phycisphaerales bacterium]|nr:MAG: hypothetical protein JSU70_02540 [Phycisphaerales bacterium]